MKCEKCGQELKSILLDIFMRDGADKWIEYPFSEAPENAAIIDTDHNWTGYELSEKEQLETILCPHCRQFPFKTEEVQQEEIVRLVLFKGNDNPDRKPTNLDRIKNMTVDEMAEFLDIIERDCTKVCAHINKHECSGLSHRTCKEGIKKWLEQEAEE